MTFDWTTAKQGMAFRYLGPRGGLDKGLYFLQEDAPFTGPHIIFIYPTTAEFVLFLPAHFSDLVRVPEKDMSPGDSFNFPRGKKR